jgi:hypothetical protein
MNNPRRKRQADRVDDAPRAPVGSALRVTADIVNEAKRNPLKTPDDVSRFHAFVLERVNAR